MQPMLLAYCKINHHCNNIVLQQPNIFLLYTYIFACNMPVTLLFAYRSLKAVLCAWSIAVDDEHVARLIKAKEELVAKAGDLQDRLEKATAENEHLFRDNARLVRLIDSGDWGRARIVELVQAGMPAFMCCLSNDMADCNHRFSPYPLFLHQNNICAGMMNFILCWCSQDKSCGMRGMHYGSFCTVCQPSSGHR